VSVAVSIPDPALVVLVGPSGAGKSTWAIGRYRQQEIVSSDALRGVVGSGENDLDASADAFAVLDTIVHARLGRGLTTVVDTLGFDALRRRALIDAAHRARLPCVAVLFDTNRSICVDRNRRRDRPVPAKVLDGQFTRMRGARDEVESEGFDLIVDVKETPADGIPGTGEIEPAHAAGSARAAAAQEERPRELGFILQISRFPWGEDPASWLGGVAAAAVESGFEGLALMDHLIQIPQVGRAWDAIPEPYVTLGMLAGLLHSRETPLRLGTLVTPVTFRAPGVVAKAVATLDALTGGRAFCGIGAGWWGREHAAYGLAMPSVGDRMQQLETAIETMRALWSPGTKAYAGTRVELPETTLYPRPVRDIPVIVGGGGERRTLQIAARLGDACNVSSRLETLDRKLAVLRRHCRDADRDPDDVAVTVLDVPVVAESRDAVASAVERLRGRTPAAVYAKQHHAGTPAQQLGRYRMLLDRGVSTVFVSLPDLSGPDEVHRFAQVIAAFSNQR
jgi:alkanesulfonate monooxygenase SsuD/methylene tetrahydromethanopterin reductase-like flavin-dependent oxidoreductase (luciferase family)/predicted kinase